MYMRFHGGGVGHFRTEVEDSEPPSTNSEDLDGEIEVVMPTPVPAEECDDEPEDDNASVESEDSDPEDEEADDEDEETTSRNEDEQDDVEGLGADHIERRLREVIIDDLGYSEM